MFKRFMARRLAAAAALLLIISFATFGLLTLAPGDPVRLLTGSGSRSPSPETIEAIRDQYHLSGSIVTRYLAWLGDAVQFDFGNSARTGEPVGSGILRRAALTAELAVMAFALMAVVGVPLGVLSAIRRGGTTDRTIVAGSIVGISTPAFASAVILTYVFSISLGWLPSFGPGDAGLDRVQHLTLPAIALAVSALALVVKITRAAMIRELEQDYVVFALSRGISHRRVVWRYAWRNALIPVVTAGGLVLSAMVAGALLVEVTFSLPGLGSLAVDSASIKDMPVLQGTVLLLAAFIIGVNLLTDLLYAVIDPRVRLGDAGGH